MRRKWLIRLGFLLALVLALLLAGRKFLSMTDFLATLATLDRSYLVPIVGLGLVYYLLKAVRWHYYLRVASLVVPLHRSIAAYLAGQWFTFTPAGELVRGYLLGSGAKFALVVPTVIVQALVDFISLALMATVVVPVYPVLAPVVLPVTLPLLAGGVVVSAPPLRRWLTTSPWLRRWTGPRQVMLHQVARLFGFRPLGIGVLMGLLAIAAAAAALYLAGLAVGVLEWQVLHAAAVYATMQLVGGISPLPQGLGVTEGSGTLLLAYLGVEPAAALAAVILFRAAILGFSIVLGLLAFLVLRLTVPELAHVPMTGWHVAAASDEAG